MNIEENLEKIKNEIPEKVCLVAVSKTKPNKLIEAAYAAGHRDFGENKAQEMQAKAEALPKDINWHFIGHLQRNKVKYIAPSVDTFDPLIIDYLLLYDAFDHVLRILLYCQMHTPRVL